MQVKELSLLDENDPILREKSEKWDFSKDGDPSELVEKMTKLMFESKGIGLAAPQCGIQKRLFIMWYPDQVIPCFNPEIISGSDTVPGTEGCLSFPKLWLNVKRFKTVKVRYQDIDGNVVETEFSDLSARVFQHELDHLDGICFDTRVSKLGLKMAKDRRRKK